jgi:hypothetical protein
MTALCLLLVGAVVGAEVSMIVVAMATADRPARTPRPSRRTRSRNDMTYTDEHAISPGSRRVAGGRCGRLFSARGAGRSRG